MDINQKLTEELEVKRWQVDAAVKLRDPVASFRYLEINGIVFPSSINFTAASTCQRFTSSSSVNF